jgi:hypothetical protein
MATFHIRGKPNLITMVADINFAHMTEGHFFALFGFQH